MPAVTIADAVQVSDSPDTKAVLQADSTTKYFLPPRMTTAQKNAISSPTEGAVVFDTDLNRLEEYSGSAWQAAGGGASSGMTSFSLAGDTGTPQTIADGNTLTIEGGTGIDTVAAATDKVTIAIDSTVATLTGAQTLTNKVMAQLHLIIGGFKAIFTHAFTADRTVTLPGDADVTLVGLATTQTLTNKTLTAPTIADFTNMAHDHLDADDGGTLSAAAIASGTLVHERGGLEADVSAYSGLIKISGGATSQAVANTDYAAATHASRHESGGADALNGDAIEANTSVTNYTPSSSTIGGHLEGIDDALGSAGGGVTIVAASGTYTAGALYQTTSTTMVDVDATNLKQTVTLNGGGVTIVVFTFAAGKLVGGNAFYRITDGTNHSNEVGIRQVDGTVMPSVIAVFDGLSAGSRTFKLQYRSSDANNAVVVATPLPTTWSVVEIS